MWIIFGNERECAGSTAFWFMIVCNPVSESKFRFYHDKSYESDWMESRCGILVCVCVDCNLDLESTIIQAGIERVHFRCACKMHFNSSEKELHFKRNYNRFVYATSRYLCSWSPLENSAPKNAPWQNDGGEMCSIMKHLSNWKCLIHANGKRRFAIQLSPFD